MDRAGAAGRPGGAQPRLALRGRALTGAALLLLAAVLLVGGAELFVDNLVGAARRLGLTALAVGVLLAGAEPEELVTAVLASAQERPGLAVGDAVGANVTMLTAALGLAALVRPLPVGVRVRRYAVGAALAGVLAAGALAGGRVTRLEGGLLLAACAGLVALVWWRERTPPAIGELAEVVEDDERAPGLALGLAVLGLAVMTAGGVAAVAGAERVVAGLGRTDTEVGLTVLALATTAELFALVLAAARRRVEEVAVAAVVGSAAYNATATLGAAALVRPLTADGALGPALLAAGLPLLLVAVAPGGRLGRAAGAVLLAAYVLFVVRTLG